MKANQTIHLLRKLLIALFFLPFLLNAQVRQLNQVLDLDFKNSIYDSSDYHHSTTASGNYIYVADNWKASGSAISFSGPSNPGGVNITDPNGEFKVSFPATISFWVKIQGFEPQNSPVFTTEDHAGSYTGMFVEITPNGGVTAQYGNGGLAGPQSRRSYTTADGLISLGKWHHVVAVYHNNLETDVYIDGFKRSTTISGDATSMTYLKITNTPAKLGTYVKGLTSRTLNGAVDKLKVFDTTLNHSEILALYYTSSSNTTKLLLNCNLNNSHKDISVYQRSTQPFSVCNYEADRLGLANAALSCSNTSSVIIKDTSNSFKCNLPMTVSFWLKATDFNDIYPIFTNEDIGNTYSGVWVQSNPGGNIAVSIGSAVAFGPGGRRSYATTNTLTAGQWNHVALVLKPVSSSIRYTVDIYFNGTLVPVAAQTGTGGPLGYNNGSESWGRIGAIYKATPNLTYFKGAIDDLMFWNDTLDSYQVNNIKNLYYNDSVSPGGSTAVFSPEKNNKATLLIYPNPSNGQFTVSINGEEAKEIKVKDITGREVWNGVNTDKLNLRLSQGNYLVEVTTLSGLVLVSKLTID